MSLILTMALSLHRLRECLVSVYEQNLCACVCVCVCVCVRERERERETERDDKNNKHCFF